MMTVVWNHKSRVMWEAGKKKPTLKAWKIIFIVQILSSLNKFQDPQAPLFEYSEEGFLKFPMNIQGSL